VSLIEEEKEMKK